MFGLQETQEMASLGSDVSYSQNTPVQEVTSSEIYSQSEADFSFYPSSYSSSTDHSVYSTDFLNHSFSDMSGYIQDFRDTTQPDIPNYFDPVAFPEDSMSSMASANTSTDSGFQSFADFLSVSDSASICGQQSQARTRGQSEGSSQSSKPKRKRVITKTQRKAANVRERRRMVTLNDAFETLKTKIPQTKDKKLSRIETLRTAITYITSMQQLIQRLDTQVPSYAGQMYSSYPRNSGGTVNTNAGYHS